MGLIDFDKLPVNNLVGADWHTYRIITSGKEIDKGFRLKHGLTTAVCRLLSIFAPIQEYRYKKLLEAAAVECSNYHQLRHTFATNCVENGYDAKTLSIVLGHSTIALTLDRYVHPNRQYERRMMNSLAVRM